MKDLVLKSSQWLRGEGSQNSGLFHYGKSCCLGVQAIQMGLDRTILANAGTPEEIDERATEDTEEYLALWTDADFDGYLQDKQVVGLAVALNDTPVGSPIFVGKSEAERLSITPILSDEDRVERLRPIFAEVGWNLVWRPDL